MRRLLSRLSKHRPNWTNKLKLPQKKFEGRFSLRLDGSRLAAFEEVTGADIVEAYRRNKGTVLDSARAKGIDYFLTDWRWAQPTALGVTPAAAKILVDDLRNVGMTRPVYLTIRGIGPTHFTRADRLPDEFMPVPDMTISVHSPIYDPATGRSFGQPYGCIIEVWEAASGSLRTARTSASLDVIDEQSTVQVVDRNGSSQPTFSAFLRRRPFEVVFPIDAVYMWVDGSDAAWIDRKVSRMNDSGVEIDSEAVSAARFVQYDELRYSLRSLTRNAPWVRRVFLVTDRQRPLWLDEIDTNLTVIDHTEIIPETALPTFNSHAIAANLHHIQGLAEHFLVVNDDVMFGRPAGPERFFHSNGTARFFLSKSGIPLHATTDLERARLHTCDLIQDRTGRRPTQVFQHTPVAFNRALLVQIWNELADEHYMTTHSPFRSSGDAVTEYLHHYIGYADQLTAPGNISYEYFGIGGTVGMDRMSRYSSRAPAEVVCVNDHSEGSETDSLSIAVESFLVDQFPHPSPYEALTG